MKVAEFVRYLMPEGSRGKGRWTDCPWWPPDLFAVCALLVERSTAYTALLDPSGSAHVLCGEPRRAKLRAIADLWRRDDWPATNRHRKAKQYLQSVWNRIADCTEELRPFDGDGLAALAPEDWRFAALELLIVADLVSAGVGFYPPRESRQRLNWIQRGFLSGGFEGLDVRARAALSSGFVEQPASFSACRFVTPSMACVHPKTRTPRVGCTLRSLSRHLALLPAEGIVRARWNVHPIDRAESHVFNLLAIPYPYRVSGASFVDQGEVAGGEGGYGLFGVRQTWLQGLPPDGFAAFVLDLVKEAKREVVHIDGIVLPELALDGATYQALIDRLAHSDGNRVQFVVAGVLGAGSATRPGFANAAATTVFTPDGKAVISFAMQKKHHRWKLDRSQITQYSLGDALDPQRDWWENARIDNRDMMFYVFREGGCFTTLVCEDLARADPGQQVIRAIGPNLVLALLMDGPQLPGRWPGRYAMGLADDPGSSVLSLTSLGLVARSNWHYKGASRSVGLWRDGWGGTRELDLPPGKHALVLSLTRRTTTDYTLDGRSDSGTADEWILSGCLPVHSDQAPE